MDGPPAEFPAGWHGELSLGFELVGERTALVHRRHRGPLLVQSPFHPEGPVCHCYLLHPPGGVVGGDTLSLRASVASKAHALLTTPAATKLYRSAGPKAEVDQSLHVAAGGILEWLPQETLAFSGAHAHLRTRVHLHPGARFIGWETLCLGRPAAEERFELGHVRQDLELWREGVPLMLERNALAAGSPALSQPWGLDGRDVLASLLLHPAEEHLVEAARRVLSGADDLRAAATAVDGVLAVRVLARDAVAVRALMLAVWTALRPRLLRREACAPRIWFT